jgi:hypothetical protein
VRAADARSEGSIPAGQLEHVVAGRAPGPDLSAAADELQVVVGVLVAGLALALERLDAGVVGLNQNLVGLSDPRTSSFARLPRLPTEGVDLIP